MKIITWNVNGLRACIKKGFESSIQKLNPDILLVQELRADRSQILYDMKGYAEFYNTGNRPGYSGTLALYKESIKPISQSITTEIKQLSEYEQEGRVQSLEFENFYLVNVYTPNSGRDLSRLNLRHKTWDPLFLEFVKSLESRKPVIFAGDLNVAPEEIDLANPTTNHKSAGFTDEEREGFHNYINSGFVDVFRKFDNSAEKYTWWSNFFNSRSRNVGWRIDHFLASEKLIKNIKTCVIHPEVMGSDHCPVEIELNTD